MANDYRIKSNLVVDLESLFKGITTFESSILVTTSTGIPISIVNNSTNIDDISFIIKDNNLDNTLQVLNNGNLYLGKSNNFIWNNSESTVHIKRVLRLGNNTVTPYGYGSALFITGTADYTTPGMTYEPFIHLQRYGGRNQIRAYRINGTPDAPAAVLAGQELYGLQIGALGPSLGSISGANIYFIRTKFDAADIGFNAIRHEFFTSGYGSTASYYMDDKGLIIRDSSTFAYSNDALASLDVRRANTNVALPSLRVQGPGSSSTTHTALFHNSTGTSNSLVIRDDGFIGIGTNSPLSKLHITGVDDKDLGPILTIGGPGINQTEGGRIRLIEGSTYQGAFIHYNALANSLYIGMHDAPDSLTSSDFNSITIIRGTGNVGIGNYTPSARLSIRGSGTTSATSALYVSNSGDRRLLEIRNDGAFYIGDGNTNLVFGPQNPNGGDNINPTLGLTMARGFLFYNAYSGAASSGNFVINNALSTTSVDNDSVIGFRIIGGVLNNTAFNIRYTNILSSPIINNTSGTTLIRGFRFEPTITSETGTTYTAFSSTKGDWEVLGAGRMILSTTTAVPSVRDKFMVIHTTPTLAEGSFGITLRENLNTTATQLSFATLASYSLIQSFESSASWETRPLVLQTSGSVGIGTTAVQAKLHVVSSGLTTSTDALRISNSSANFLRVRDDGNIILGSGTGNWIYPYTGVYSIDATGNNLAFSNRNSSSEASSGMFAFQGNNMTHTSGMVNFIMLARTWMPSSGDASFNQFYINNTINTTGTYSGIIRGIYYNPNIQTLVGATHRAFESTHGDWVIGGRGSLGIGTTTLTNKFNIIGYIRGANNELNNSAKDFFILNTHYINSEESFNIISGVSNVNQNIVFIGGGVNNNFNSATDIRFYTSSNNITLSGTERMRITMDGNIGIGLNTPLARLHVKGSGSTSSTYSFWTENASGTKTFSIDDAGNIYTLGSIIGSTVGAAGSTGQIQFNNSNVLAASPNLFWDNTNSRLGIGTNLPDAKFTLADTLNSLSTTLFSSSNLSSLIYADNKTLSAAMYVASTTSGHRPLLIGYKSKGTLSSPLAVIQGEQLFSIIGSGYDGTSMQNGAEIVFYSNYDSTTGNVPTGISFKTGNNSSDRTDRLTITSLGYIGIGIGSPAYLLDIEGNLGVGVSSTTTSRMRFKSTTQAIINTTDAVPFHIEHISGSKVLTLTGARQLQLPAYGLGTFTGTPTYSLYVDSSGNVIEIPVESGPVNGSGVTGRVAFWSDANTLTSSKGFLFDDTNKRFVLNTAAGTDLSSYNYYSNFNIVGNVVNFSMDRWNGGVPHMNLRHARGGVVGTHSATLAGDIIGAYQMWYSNGTSFQRALTLRGLFSDSGKGMLRLEVGTSEADSNYIFTTTSQYGIVFGANLTPTQVDAYGSTKVVALGSGTTSSTYTAQFHNSTGTSNSLMIRDDGNIGIGTISPSEKLSILGNILGTSNETNDTAKEFNLLSRHYTNSEEHINIIRGVSNISQNIIYIGGGLNNIYNSATDIIFYTGTNNTTLNGTEQLRITYNGIGINNANPVNLIDIVAKGNTISTASINIKDSANNTIYRFNDNGSLRFGTTGNLAPLIHPTSESSVGVIDINSMSLAITSRHTTSVAYGMLLLTGNPIIATSGNGAHVRIARNFEPTSGNTVLNWLAITGNINQTGGANGITRGIYIAQSLTSAASYRAVEVTNNTGYAFFSSGSAPSYLSGSLGIGASGNPISPSASLHIVGSGNTSSTYTLKALNSSSTESLSIRDDGMLTATGRQLHSATYTATVTNDYSIKWMGTMTGTATVSDQIPFSVVNPTLVAGANSQGLAALKIDPTFTNGAFTGVANYALHIKSGGIRAGYSSISSYNYSNTEYTFLNTHYIIQSSTNQNLYLIDGGASYYQRLHWDKGGVTTWTLTNTAATIPNLAFQYNPNSPSGMTLNIVRDSGIGIGSLGALITPTASLHIVGSGTTSSTFTAQYHNSTGTSNSLVIRDDGFIGIGTSSPLDKLHIQNSSVNNYIILGNNPGDYANATYFPDFANINSSINFSRGTDGLLRGSTIFNYTTTDTTPYNNLGIVSRHKIKFVAGELLRMTIDNAGRIGIGNSLGTYSGMLHVGNEANGSSGYGTPIDFIPQIQIAHGTAAGIGIYSSEGLKYGRMSMFVDNASSLMGIAGTYSTGMLGMVFRFANVEAMRIHSNMNISIGTTSMLGRFAVVGSGVTSSTITAAFHNSTGNSNSLVVLDDGNVGIGVSTPVSRLQVRGGGTTSSSVNTQLLNSSSTVIFTVLDSGKTTINGTYTGTTSNESGLLLNQTITTRNTLGDQNNALEITSTLIANNNNQKLVGLRVKPTFNNSTFTGVNNVIAEFIGNNGTQLIIDDNVTGVIYSVNDSSGIPIIEVTDTYNILFYNGLTTTLQKIGNNIGINTSLSSLNENLHINGRIFIENTTVPGTTTNRLYAVSGNLFWNGQQLSITPNQVQYYDISTINADYNLLLSTLVSGDGISAVGHSIDVKYNPSTKLLKVNNLNIGASSGIYSLNIENTKISVLGSYTIPTASGSLIELGGTVTATVGSGDSNYLININGSLTARSSNQILIGLRVRPSLNINSNSNVKTISIASEGFSNWNVFEGNVSLFESISNVNFGGGQGIVSIKEANTVPSSNPPIGTFYLYVENNELKALGSSGTVTVLATA